MIGAGEAAWGDWFQLCFAAAMAILAVILVIEAIGTFRRQAARKAAWIPPHLGYDRGYVQLYISHVEGADKGADLDFLKGKARWQTLKRVS